MWGFADTGTKDWKKSSIKFVVCLYWHEIWVLIEGSPESQLYAIWIFSARSLQEKISRWGECLARLGFSPGYDFLLTILGNEGGSQHRKSIALHAKTIIWTAQLEPSNYTFRKLVYTPLDCDLARLLVVCHAWSHRTRPEEHHRGSVTHGK